MIRVGVIRGGVSPEYDVSMKTGARVLKALRDNFADKYIPLDIYIDRTGRFHAKGFPIEPEWLADSVDVVFNALHGVYGEDGAVQALFEKFNIPFVGSPSDVSEIACNKVTTKSLVKRLGIDVAPHLRFDDYRRHGGVWNQEAYLQSLIPEIRRELPPPWIIKPVSGGSSIGVTYAKNPEQLFDALLESSKHPGDFIVESFVYGTEATVGVIDHFRGEPIYAFLPIEIGSSKETPIFSYSQKTTDPLYRISRGVVRTYGQELLAHAKTIHKALGLRHYSRSDFIITPYGKIIFLEVNNQPGLTDACAYPRAVEGVGGSFAELVDHLVTLARMQY